METLTIGTEVQTIGSSAFYGCEALISVIIPDSVTFIDSAAFQGCIHMKTVKFGNGLTTIGLAAFRGCISLTEVMIPTNVVTIDGDYWSGGAFEDCTGLKKVVIGDDTTDIAITSIGERAFYNCTALEEVYIGSNVKDIAENAFEGCISLVNFNIGTGVQHIGAYALANCTDLNSVTIPGNVLTIGDNLFNNCTALDDVTIVRGKESIRSFGSNVFNGCSSFDRIYYTGTSDDWNLINISEDNVYPLNTTPYYYSEEKPSSKGNFWYYNSNSEIRVWNVAYLSYQAESYSETFIGISDLYDDTYHFSLAGEVLDYIDTESDVIDDIVAWETIHVMADPAYLFDRDNGIISKKDIYKFVLYDMLTGSSGEEDNNMFEWFSNASTSFVFSTAKMIIGDEAALDMETIKSTLKTMDASKVKKVLESAVDPDIFEQLSLIINVCEDAYEATLACARYEALRQTEAGYIEVLQMIVDDTDNPWDLRLAAEECIEYYQSACSLTRSQFENKAMADATEDSIYDFISEKFWDVIISSNPLLEAANFTAKGVRALLSPLGMDETCENYYKLKTAVGIEYAIKRLLAKTLPDYFRYGCISNAEQYMCAVVLYQRAVFFGNECTFPLIQIEYNRGNVSVAELALINRLRIQKYYTYAEYENDVSNSYVEYYNS